MAELQTSVKQGAVIGGWVCFGVGILFMVHSLWAFIFYVPLFLAASVLSIIAMAQGRVGGGLTLLLCCVITPPIAFVYCLGLMAQCLQASDSLKSLSPSPWLETATPAQAQSKFTSEATSTPSPAELATTSSTPLEVAPQTFPESTFTAAPNALDASLATATPALSKYRVIGVSRDDYLNVREGARSNYPVIATLEPGTGGIVLGTKRVANGETTWQEISIRGHSGWVNADYIALETQATASPTPSPAQ
jgi:Bacterial SH3 domain